MNNYFSLTKGGTKENARIVCEDTGEVFLNYRAYMSSRHWTALKAQFYRSRRYKGCCEKCRQVKRNLQIHHRHYRTLGREELSDLQALCLVCHSTQHKHPLKARKMAQSPLGTQTLSLYDVDDILLSIPDA